MYRMGPPVRSKRDAISAKHSMIAPSRSAQATNTSGLHAPASAAAPAGTPKMPAPIMPLSASRAMPSAPIWRIRPSFAGGDGVD